MGAQSVIPLTLSRAIAKQVFRVALCLLVIYHSFTMENIIDYNIVILF